MVLGFSAVVEGEGVVRGLVVEVEVVDVAAVVDREGVADWVVVDEAVVGLGDDGGAEALPPSPQAVRTTARVAAHPTTRARMAASLGSAA